MNRTQGPSRSDVLGLVIVIIVAASTSIAPVAAQGFSSEAPTTISNSGEAVVESSNSISDSVTVTYTIDEESLPAEGTDSLYLTTQGTPDGWEGVSATITAVQTITNETTNETRTRTYTPEWVYGTERWQYRVTESIGGNTSLRVNVTYEASTGAAGGLSEFGLRVITSTDSWTVSETVELPESKTPTTPTPDPVTVTYTIDEESLPAEGTDSLYLTTQGTPDGWEGASATITAKRSSVPEWRYGSERWQYTITEEIDDTETVQVTATINGSSNARSGEANIELLVVADGKTWTENQSVTLPSDPSKQRVSFEIDPEALPSGGADEMLMSLEDVPRGWEGVSAAIRTSETFTPAWEYGTERWQYRINEHIDGDTSLRVAVTYEGSSDAVSGPSTMGLRIITSNDSWTVERSVDLPKADAPPEEGQQIRLTTSDKIVTLNSSARTNITFEATNIGAAPSVVGINITHLPNSFEAVGADSEGGQWQSGQLTWFWLSKIEPNESVTGTLSIEIPDSVAAGTYDIKATAGGGESTATANASIVIQKEDNSTEPPEENVSVRAAIAGDDNSVGFDDVLTAIRWYNNETIVPNTGGETVSFQDVLEAIQRYNTES
jgi:hypothetical protein